MSVLLGIATTLGCFILLIIGVAIIWSIWELFRDLVLGFEKTRIQRLEDWQDAWQPFLEQLKKEEDKKIQKGKLK